MATGFTANEWALSRLMCKSIEMGTSGCVYGVGGTRTVGPLVHLAIGANGEFGYWVNGENGIYLGRTYADARKRIIAIHRAQ